MAKQRSLADGLIRINSTDRGDRVEVRVEVLPERRHPRLPLITSGPVLTWARWFLVSEIEAMLAAQVAVLRAEGGRDIEFDDDVNDVRETQNLERVVELLEYANPETCFTMLRAPDVIDAIVAVIRGDDRSLRQRLQRALRRCASTRRGAPAMAAEDRLDFKTALWVSETEAGIAESFELVQSLRKSGKGRITDRLMATFDISSQEATILARSKTLSMAACRLVAEKTGRSFAAVKMAARRGNPRTSGPKEP